MRRLWTPIIGLAAATAPSCASAARGLPAAPPQPIAPRSAPPEAEDNVEVLHPRSRSLATYILGEGPDRAAEPRSREPGLLLRERSLLAELGWRRWGLGAWRHRNGTLASRGGAVASLANATVRAGDIVGDGGGTFQQAQYSQQPVPQMAPWQGTGERERQVRDLAKDTAKQRSLREPRHILGVPKVLWALILDILAMLAFVACIPFILTIAKRKRAPPPPSNS